MPREKIVRRRLSDGTVREYRYPLSGKATVGRLIVEYRASAEYGSLARSSKRSYDLYMQRIGESYHAVAVEDVRRRHIKGMQDAWQHMPATANEIVKTWSVLRPFAAIHDDHTAGRTTDEEWNDALIMARVAADHRWSYEKLVAMIYSSREIALQTRAEKAEAEIAKLRRAIEVALTFELPPSIEKQFRALLASARPTE